MKRLRILKFSFELPDLVRIRQERIRTAISESFADGWGAIRRRTATSGMTLYAVVVRGFDFQIMPS